MSETAVTGEGVSYYGGVYWNSFARVIYYMSEDFTGDRLKWWATDFKERFAQQPFERGLFLNCGNGWVERDLIDQGIVSHAVGFDYSFDLLRQAEAKKGERSISYFQADVNKVVFGENQFDLIVNVAAMHHVQYINRLCRILCAALKEDGYFLNYDYIGPHRNQYSFRHWLRINQVNRSLPKSVRKDPIVRPHLPTMVYVDPTEAIHSDLIIESMGRFFDIFERHDTGGGIAYEILTHNDKLAALPEDELNPHLDHLLAIDRQMTREHKVPPLFSYFIARPQKERLQDRQQIELWQAEENHREDVARRRKWVYSNREYFLMLMHTALVKVVNNRIRGRLKQVRDYGRHLWRKRA